MDEKKFQDRHHIISYFDDLANKIDLQTEEILEKENKECEKNAVNTIRKKYITLIDQLRDFNLKNISQGYFRYCFFIPNTKKILKIQELYGISRTNFLFDNRIGKLIILDINIDDEIISELTNYCNRIPRESNLFQKNIKSLKNFLIATILFEQIDSKLTFPVINLTIQKKLYSLNLDLLHFDKLDEQSLDIFEHLIDCSQLECLSMVIMRQTNLPCFDIYEKLVSLENLTLEFKGGVKNENFKALENLKELNLIEITALEDKAFYGQNNLTNLSIKNSKVEKLTNRIFSQLDDLINLDLYSNKINSISNQCFANLKNLKILNLSHNCLKKLNQYELNGLNKLEKLEMNNNSIEIIHPKALKQLHRLEILIIYSNRIKKIEPSTFMFQKNLKYLNLENNLIANLNFLARLKNLEILNLKGNVKLESNTALENFHLPKLKMLAINCTAISTFSDNLVNLQALEIYDLKSIDEGSFKNLKNIDYLILNLARDNFINSLNENHLEGLSGLKYFLIENSHSLDILKQKENIFKQIFNQFDSIQCKTERTRYNQFFTQIKIVDSVRKYFEDHLMVKQTFRENICTDKYCLNWNLEYVFL
ncbi:insulin-like growth factor-binding complex acid labile subunit isoform X3 [Brachionus plicatilis]|uniref:Insulin-like growth factor-binding complex acid labile subunit isoform X3 n=1 Tax=Brachionus plicatilis TaxID=10195 RepID=A0A3M7RTH6_BRAPC|nr:insulin-like growth factor-binding complex acid labile subunit isoform X3 [Brachionus plicatilis]